MTTSPKKEYFRFLILLFIIILLVSLSGCDWLYSFLDKEGAEEKKLIGEALPYNENPAVEEIQKLLKLYGYDPGKIDGVLGFRTRNAIERFQKDRGLKITRFVDKDTWAELILFRNVGLVKKTEINVELLQGLLKKSGHDPGKIDGKMGAQTRKAVVAFQKNHQLKPDGKVGYLTLQKLSAYFSQAN